MPPTLYFVRPKAHTDRHGDPSRNKPPFGIEAVFPDRAEAEEYQRRREKEEERKANWGPVRDLMYTLWCNEGSLRSLSDFEPPVFADWLADHCIPEPDAIWQDEPTGGDPVGEYLTALGPDRFRKLLTALHRFRYFEIVEAPLVVGDYPTGQREPWENELPAGPPAPPGLEVNAALNQVMLEQTMREIAEHFGLELPPASGLEVPPVAGEDEAIPF